MILRLLGRELGIVEYWYLGQADHLALKQGNRYLSQ